MEKKFFLLLILPLSSLFGAILLDMTSFQADFTQQIDDKENKVVTYTGKVYAKKPQTALWQYSTPVRKDVYISKKKVMIIEPEIEQVIVRQIKDDFDFFQLLQEAKKIGKNKYQAYYKEKLFTLYFDGKNIQKLTYKDNFDNEVTITFSNQKYNIQLQDALFTPVIPKEYDLIME
jgi:outer membrane lipoprotein carrier protein